MNVYTGERLLLTLWVGSLWAIGYLAVPVAFVTMETHLAGEYAGKLFQIVNYLGIACGAMLLISRLFIFGVRQFHQYWRSWVLLLMLACCTAFIVYLQPEIQHIKALNWQQDAILSARFDSFHKLSENLYLILSFLGLLLILTTDKRAETGLN